MFSEKSPGGQASFRLPLCYGSYWSGGIKNLVPDGLAEDPADSEGGEAAVAGVLGQADSTV